MDTIFGTEHKQRWNDVPHKCYRCGKMFYAKYINSVKVKCPHCGYVH